MGRHPEKQYVLHSSIFGHWYYNAIQLAARFYYESNVCVWSFSRRLEDSKGGTVSLHVGPEGESFAQARFQGTGTTLFDSYNRLTRKGGLDAREIQGSKGTVRRNRGSWERSIQLKVNLLSPN